MLVGKIVHEGVPAGGSMVRGTWYEKIRLDFTDVFFKYLVLVISSTQLRNDQARLPSGSLGALDPCVL